MSRRRRWVIVAITAVVILGALYGVTQHVSPTPLGYASKTAGVEFYPACGNTPLKNGGLTWYPISREGWSRPVVESSAASGGMGGRGLGAARLPMVPAPGPGDDVGTLYVYRDGIAYWVSDSRNLDQWLTLVPQTYNWVC